MAEPNTAAIRKSTIWPTVATHAALHRCRRNVIELVSRRDPGADSRGLDVAGLIWHLTMNSRQAEAALTGGAPGPASWLDLELPDLLAEWERSGTVVERALRGARGLAGEVLLTDLFIHELDLRKAFDAPEPAGHPALPVAFDIAVNRIGAIVGVLGLRPLRLETSGAAWDIGEGDVAIKLWATPLDLYECLIGRRTPPQIRALRWSADPGPWIRVFAPDTLRPWCQPVNRSGCPELAGSTE